MADRGAASEPERRWYGVSETAARLGVSRQTLHERVRRLQGARKVDGRWRIPAEVVEALVTAERAKAVASGSLVLLPDMDVEDAKGGPGVVELAERVAELERLVREQADRFSAELANRDALIAELRADRQRLRRTLGAVMQGLSHLVADDEAVSPRLDTQE